jgi:hypothetical protein
MRHRPERIRSKTPSIAASFSGWFRATPLALHVPGDHIADGRQKRHHQADLQRGFREILMALLEQIVRTTRSSPATPPSAQAAA